MCMPGVSGDHKDRLELQIAVSRRVGAGGVEPQSSGQAVNAHNC